MENPKEAIKIFVCLTFALAIGLYRKHNREMHQAHRGRSLSRLILSLLSPHREMEKVALI